MTWNPPPLPARVTDRFTWILNALVVFISCKHRPGVEMGLLGLITRRVVRTRNRFAALVARYRAGMLRPPRPRAKAGAKAGVKVGAGEASPQTDRPPRPRSPLPRGRAWLSALVPSWAASCDNYLRQLLDEPEMREIIAAAPQAGRLLRPLLWMLGNAPMPAILVAPRRAKVRPPPLETAPLETAPLNTAPPEPQPGAPAWERKERGRPDIAPPPPRSDASLPRRDISPLEISPAKRA